jgi:ubiquinol-cytochrome c reductase cytochrome c subunit
MRGVPSAIPIRRAVVVAPVLVALVAAGATLDRTGGDRATAIASRTEARSTWLADCATCHATDAHGTSRGPSLEGVGEASIDFMVRTGRMPLPSPEARDERRPSPYSAAQQDALVSYVTSLAGPGGPDVPHVDGRGDPAAGGELYRLQCAACHSWGGGGGALVDRDAPSILPATPTQLGEAVRIGPGTMPVFGRAALSDRQLDDLAAYSTELQHPSDRGGWALSHLGPVSEGAVALVIGLGAILLITRWLGAGR